MVIRRRTLDNARTPGCRSRDEFENATTTKQRALPCEYYELRIGSVSSERNAHADSEKLLQTRSANDAL